jgi:uncharacterized RDD family membrane protein YckC
VVGRQVSEAIADLLVRHHFVERVARQMLATADLESAAVSALEDKRTEQIVKRVLASPAFERMVVEALESQVAADMMERVLSSPETEQALERVLTSPAVRAAFAQQTATFAGEMAAGVRSGAERLDDAVERSVSRRRTPPATAEEASAYAGLASRGVAFVVDAIISHVVVLTAGALVSFAASLFGGLGSGWLVSGLAGTGWALFVATYFVVFWTVTGQTPGMRLMRLRVIGRGGAPPTVGRSLLRYFGLLLAIAPLFTGFLPALFDARRRALQDFLAGTVVVHSEDEAFHPIGVMTGTARAP